MVPCCSPAIFQVSGGPQISNWFDLHPEMFYYGCNASACNLSELSEQAWPHVYGVNNTVLCLKFQK